MRYAEQKKKEMEKYAEENMKWWGKFISYWARKRERDEEKVEGVKLFASTLRAVEIQKMKLLKDGNQYEHKNDELNEI